MFACSILTKKRTLKGALEKLTKFYEASWRKKDLYFFITVREMLMNIFFLVSRCFLRFVHYLITLFLAASLVSSVLSDSIKSAVLSQFLQLYNCRSVSCQRTYFYWWGDKIEVFSHCALFSSDQAMFSHGIVLHCCILYCHFSLYCTVLCSLKKQVLLLCNALTVNWRLAFCLCRFVFVAFSAP